MGGEIPLTDWIEANIQAVAKSYPQFRAVEPPVGSGVIRAWKGSITPLNASRGLGLILDDLANGRPVLVQAGQLVHDHKCEHTQGIIDLPQAIHRIEQSFELQIFMFAPECHPKAFCVSPEISKRTYPQHEHLHLDSSVCAYQPSDRVLPWDNRTMTTFLHFVAIWTAKHLVWQNTGKWLGPVANHAPHEILRYVGRNDPCPCGLGKKFKKCCLPRYEQATRLSN